MDYDFRQIDLRDESETARAHLRGWLQAMRRAFREGRPDEEFEKQWLSYARQDEQTITGAWLPEGAFGASDVPVATFATFDKTLNMGREVIPARLITDVTSSPAHRRKGLVRRLMESALERASADGMPVAALTVSEATIYGRWGFGVAAQRRSVELDSRHGFALRHFTDPGRIEMVDPRESWTLMRQVYEQFHQQTRGSLGLPAFYEPWLTGAYDFESGEDKSVQAVVHLDAAEQVDGFAVYKPKDVDGQPQIKVTDMAALNGPAQLGLWNFLAGVDLANKVTYAVASAQDPLQWALTDFNRLRTTAISEFIWLRVLDVRRTFEARSWAADGQTVVEVEDAQGYTAGRWQVTTRDGVAGVVPTEVAADVHLHADTLATLALAPVGVTTLRDAGRIRGDDAAVARLAAMADLTDEPYNLMAF